MYLFKVVHQPDAIEGTSKLFSAPRELPIDMPLEHYGKYMARYRGALLHLFGEPNTTTDDGYEYLLEATDGAGQTWILTVYEGPSGSAVGGHMHDDSVFEVADALIDLIELTPPADFNVTYYNAEYDSTVTYGCRDGSCYYQEEHGQKET